MKRERVVLVSVTVPSLYTEGAIAAHLSLGLGPAECSPCLGCCLVAQDDLHVLGSMQIPGLLLGLRFKN